MKTIEITVYKFDELSAEAQETAINKLYDLNVDFDWWDGTYGDAKSIGLEITEFDIDRGSYAKGLFINSATECAWLITDNHGENCQTWLIAKEFLNDYDTLVKKYSDGVNLTVVAEGKEDDFDSEVDDLEAEFLKSLLEDYRIILSKEYDYLTSRESVIESIKANDYDFTEAGEMY